MTFLLLKYGVLARTLKFKPQNGAGLFSYYMDNIILGGICS